MYKGLAFRSMHSHGRALNGLMPRAVDDVEDYRVREGELVAGVVLGYNFGDGHFHNHRLLAAVQERCHFEPGELRVVTLESQPAHVPAPALPDPRRRHRPGRGGLRRTSPTWSAASPGSARSRSRSSRMRPRRATGRAPAA